MTSALNLTKKLQEQIWVTIKYILSSETELLINRHIDTLILSSVYSVCKVF